MVASTLPKYIVSTVHVNTEEGSFDLLRVTCPRKKCGMDFYVRRTWLCLTSHVVGRACPWCHKSAEIPEELRIPAPSPEDELPINKPRRIVRRRKSKEN